MPLLIVGVDKFIEALGWEVEEVDELEIKKSDLDSANRKIVIFNK